MSFAIDYRVEKIKKDRYINYENWKQINKQ